MPLPPRIYLSSPHMGTAELELVKEAFATNWIAPLGPHVDKFESEFVEMLGRPEGQKIGGSESQKSNLPALRSSDHPALHLSDHPAFRPSDPPPASKLHAAALTSGTAAIHLALRWLGVGPGDEVICSTFTFSATVNPVLYERATPVFVDSDRRSWNMDPTLLAEAIADGIRRGKKPKAVIVVHLYGQSADLDPIVALCERHEIPLIEDAAEALGAIYFSRAHGKPEDQRARMPETRALRPSDTPAFQPSAPPVPRPSGLQALRPSATPIAPGTAGLAGVFSFNGNKIITTSGGGMLVSRDEALIKKARFWATQSRDPAPHYQHSEVGFNYRLSNVLAGIGRGQLRVLLDRVEARRRNFEFYTQTLGDLPGLSFMPEADFGRCTRWLTCITVDPRAGGAEGQKAGGPDREKIRLALEAENIESRPTWKPMHLQPIFKGCRSYGGGVSEQLFADGLCLPSGSNLTQTDLNRVVAVIRKVFGKT
jgi:dTDP-4-amino-4,6-dideoxygalactose transaminase